MEDFVKTVIIFCLIEWVLLEPVPDLVIGRTMKDVEGAEFYAMDTIGLGEELGYPVEQHNITTTDGYLLNIFHIPWSPRSEGLNKIKIQKKPVVFLQSGMAASSDVWLVRGVNRSLAVQLADSGYDVWLGNYRGNTYGRAHVTLSPEDRKFWDFSHHESGIYDLPNSIDYILRVTNESSLTYVGHSLGTTTIFITLSELPEYNEKINLLIMFAPVSVWSQVTPFRKIGAALGRVIQRLIEPNGTVEFIPQSSVFAGFLKRICIPNGIFDFCLLPFDTILGKDHWQLDKADLVRYTCHYPSGTSGKMIYHYLQSAESGKFRHWDFENYSENMKHYGQPQPPEYKLENVRSPMVILWAKNDPLSGIIDIREFIKKISSKVISEPVRFKYFNHIDFVTANDVKKLVNDRVLYRLNQFKNGEI